MLAHTHTHTLTSFIIMIIIKAGCWHAIFFIGQMVDADIVATSSKMLKMQLRKRADEPMLLGLFRS